MKISSNYYDYYSQMYQLNSLSNTQVNTDSQIDTDDSNSSKNKTKAISSIQTRSYVPDEDVDITDLNYSGIMLANSLKLQNDMSSIKNPYGGASKSQKMDIDSMTESDIKAMLKKIQEHANKMSMMGGVEPSETSNSIAENQNSTSTIDYDIVNENISQ